jgi:hypothetical protein
MRVLFADWSIHGLTESDVRSSHSFDAFSFARTLTTSLERCSS